MSLLKYSLNGPTLCHTKMPFYAVFGTKGSMRVQLGQAAALYCRVSTADQTCARQERDLRAFARKACYKGRRGLEGNRLRGKAGTRRTDPLDARSVPHAAGWGLSSKWTIMERVP